MGWYIASDRLTENLKGDPQEVKLPVKTNKGPGAHVYGLTKAPSSARALDHMRHHEANTP